MQNIVSYEKMSKKEKRKFNARKRVMWSDYGVQKPYCKKIPDKKKSMSKNMCRDFKKKTNPNVQ